MSYENWDTVVSLDITRAELYTIANCVNSVVVMGEICDFLVGYEKLDEGHKKQIEDVLTKLADLWKATHERNNR
jgi:hypothetical protein